MGSLTFEEPAREDFPCLDLAYRALEAGRSLPIVLNAANEVAVASFLEGHLRFTSIPDVIVRTMDAHHAGPAEGLRDVRRIDAWARAHADEAVRELQST
jgi:1-deoxy-D-xylulose-5-phosphate reductoisomerase